MKSFCLELEQLIRSLHFHPLAPFIVLCQIKPSKLSFNYSILLHSTHQTFLYTSFDYMHYSPVGFKLLEKDG